MSSASRSSIFLPLSVVVKIDVWPRLLLPAVGGTLSGLSILVSMAGGARARASMRLVTWNVNSIRARQERVLAWLAVQRPTILCLQETKVTDEAFPARCF